MQKQPVWTRNDCREAPEEEQDSFECFAMKWEKSVGFATRAMLGRRESGTWVDEAETRGAAVST
jgi:hypothetical protein